MLKRKWTTILMMMLVLVLISVNSVIVTAEKKAIYGINPTGLISSTEQSFFYTITYNANNGTGAPAAEKRKRGKISTLSVKQPTRKGYQFLGWAETANAKEPVYQPGDLYKKNKSVTLYAVWTGNKYYIHYDANGGEGTMKSHTATYGINKTLRTNVFTRKGYAFAGWNTKADGSGTALTDGQKVKKLTTVNKKKVTLYAQWNANKYHIYYNANGGEGTMNSHTATYGVGKTLRTNVFTRKGYVFTGWNTKADGSGTALKDKQKVKRLTWVNNKKVTLYAQWKKGRFTATGMDYSSYSVNDIVKYFVEVVCDTEYSTGDGDVTVVQKWTEPIYYKVTGKPTKKDLQVIQDLCENLNAIKGFPGIYQEESGGYYNLSINFWNEEEFYDNMGEFINYENSDGAVQYWYDTYGNYMLSATIGCRTDISQYVRNSVIQEEIINGLGLTDTWLREDSIVYAGYSEPQNLSVMDWVIVELLYHPDIKCGMNAAKCGSVIKKILG